MSEDEYIVEKVVDKRIIGGEIEYLIKWEGYDSSENTWEPPENLDNIGNLIQEFENRKKKKEINWKIEGSNARVLEFQGVDDLVNEIKDQIPERITTVKDHNGEIYALVIWQPNSDGISPDSCYIKSSLLAEIYPKLLIEFYETKIKFVNKNKI
jgi:hypothetical protein